MSNYQLYQEVLASAGEGTPLWEPAPSPNHVALSIGDVGYLRFGAFIRLFNALLPPGHPDNENGEPPNHVPLMVHTTTVRSILPAGVVAASGAQTTAVSQKEADAHIHFKCTARAGAVVMSSSEVHRQDVASQSLTAFAEYMAEHAHEWAMFARVHLMQEVALQELIFVTGCDTTHDKYSVTAFNSARISKKTEASFRLPHPASKSHTWAHSPAISYFQHNYGPRRAARVTEQCLFVRGFKILDRRIEQLERRDVAKSWFVESCCDTQSRGPLDAVLRYLNDKSDARVSVAHDYDVARLLTKHDVTYDYAGLLKQLKKSRRPIVRRGNGTVEFTPTFHF